MRRTVIPERYRIVTFEGSFHGRTLATLAASKNKKHLDGFGPPMDGFDRVPLGDIEAVKTRHRRRDAGIFIEPLQGEGGVRMAQPQFFKALRQLCDEKGLLLAFDEVQTGIGRLRHGIWLSKLGVTPDVMGLAEELSAGLSGRRGAGHRRGRQGHDTRHPWPRPSATTRWRWRPAMP